MPCAGARIAQRLNVAGRICWLATVRAAAPSGAPARAASSQHQAPPFRTLGQGYPIDNLAEALAEGFCTSSTGYPDKPEFVFEIRDVAAILAYLQFVQEP
jgi:cytochrome c